jgi:cytochrome c-type biogenesis protein CcmE
MKNVLRSGRGIALAAGLIIVLGGFGYLLYGGIGENLVYFLTPKELLAKGSKVYDTPLRLGGMVVPGSVQWDAKNLDLRFRIGDGEKEVAVHAKGAPPQMFRDGMGVVVEGRYGPDGVFQSTNLMVKHSNEYHPPKEGQMPQEIYKSLMKEESRT